MNVLPSLRQLRYLVALAETKHFGRAADACFVTQSTLSAGLKELESQLGVTLVERTKRRVMVTLLHALRQHGKKSGIATLCIGGGEAVAMGVELV